MEWNEQKIKKSTEKIDYLENIFGDKSLVKTVKWQTDHIRHTSFDSPDENGGEVTDSVRSGLVSANLFIRIY